MTTIATITTATANGAQAPVAFPVAPLQIRVSGLFDGCHITLEASDGGTGNFVPLTKLEDGAIMKFQHQGRYQIHVLDADNLRVVLNERGPATAIVVEALP